MKDYVDAILLERAQRGWRCTMAFTVTTHQQSTDELHNLVTGHPWLLVSVLKGLAGVYREKRRLMALPGPHNHADLSPVSPRLKR